MKALSLLLLALIVAGCARSGRETAAATSDALERNPASASDGAVLYLQNCSSCHQSDGRGVPGAFPPLAGNPVVSGNPTAVIAIVKNGLDGRLIVNGGAYSGIMPRWGGVLSDEQLADVISYIRTSWKNQGKPVSTSDVAAVKL